MDLAFTARGHEHILATHRSTLAFTREDWLTMRGDCIVAVSADFEEKSLRKFLEKLPDASPIVVTISAGEHQDRFEALLNREFSDKKEMVFRLSEHRSGRTLGIRATKAAAHLDRTLVSSLSRPETTVAVRVAA